jgi:hypothetical protein
MTFVACADTYHELSICIGAIGAISNTVAAGKTAATV